MTAATVHSYQEDLKKFIEFLESHWGRFLLPGDVTPYHSHRFPVTVYMIEGAFTLELDGRAPVVIGAGEAFVEPAHVNMTGRNKGDVPARMALFYVCEPDAPFADPVNRQAEAH